MRFFVDQGKGVIHNYLTVIGSCGVPASAPKK